MSSSNVESAWGQYDEPTASKWQQSPSNKQLAPYRVKYDGEVYSQAEFLKTDDRYYNFTSGIGAGKTVAGILRVAANVQRWNPGETGMIIAPTVPALKNVILPEFRKWNFLSSWEYYGPQSEAPGLHCPNGSRILLESATNERKIDRLRGPSIAWFWIDEAAQVPRRTWDVLVGRLRSGDYQNGFITTTPKGYNWVHERFVDPDTKLSSVENVLGVPSHANPFNPTEYQAIVEEYDGRFYQQEALGKFVGFEGLVYPWFATSEHVLPIPEGATSVYDALEANVRRVIYGVDWGHNNPSAILAIGETTREEFVVLEEFHESRVTDNDLVGVATKMQQRHGEGPFYCDPSEPDAIDTFQRAGIDALAADNSVLTGIKHVAGLRDRLRVVESCQSLINEFGMYRYPDDQKTATETPVEVNDHALDALRYALLSDRGGIQTGMEGVDLI
jgi:PBSX family phage terminase large subunit